MLKGLALSDQPPDLIDSARLQNSWPIGFVSYISSL